jgi:eukaryotic-like serine/threonine-protein kinase
VPQEQLITVFVSSGRNQVSVPPIVINVASDVARQTLESDEYGLRVEIREQEDPVVKAGIVINTEPAPNTLVDRGTTVVLIVSSGPGQVRVPPLIGLTEGQARNKLDDLGFGQPEVSYQELAPGDARDGTVLEQSIPTAQLADKGTVLQLVVGQSRVAETTTTTSTTTTTTTTLPPATTPPTTAPPGP